MVFCIFPSVFVVILGPAMIQIAQRSRAMAVATDAGPRAPARHPPPPAARPRGARASTRCSPPCSGCSAGRSASSGSPTTRSSGISAPAVHPRLRLPPQRPVLVQRAGHALGRAVLARRGRLRGHRPRDRALRDPRRSSASPASLSPCSPSGSRCGSPSTGCGPRCSPPWRWPASPRCGRSARSCSGSSPWSSSSGSWRCPTRWLGRRPLVAIPVLLWCWANVHGTFVLGFAYLGIASRRSLARRPPALGGTGAPVARRRRRRLRGRVPQPVRRQLVTFPTVLLSRADILRHIVEWGSPDFHSLRGELFAVWIVMFVVLLVARARGR